ncbi:hypothetical protein SESBI_19344 [Sesbania bispinosa]|nr:hypothetical protein SESBI_19344 [Sesbania bispinosa]
MTLPSVVEWTDTILNHLDDPSATLFAAVVYGIWSSRNKLVFESNHTPRAKVIEGAKKQAEYSFVLPIPECLAIALLMQGLKIHDGNLLLKGSSN